jgi:murein tripeptide amidase MpaA
VAARFLTFFGSAVARLGIWIQSSASANRADHVCGEVLSEKVVWQLIKPYAEVAGVPGIAPP